MSMYQASHARPCLSTKAEPCLARLQFLVAVRTEGNAAGPGAGFQNLTNDQGEVTSHIAGPASMLPALCFCCHSPLGLEPQLNGQLRWGPGLVLIRTIILILTITPTLALYLTLTWGHSWVHRVLDAHAAAARVRRQARLCL